MCTTAGGNIAYLKTSRFHIARKPLPVKFNVQNLATVVVVGFVAKVIMLRLKQSLEIHVVLGVSFSLFLCRLSWSSTVCVCSRL